MNTGTAGLLNSVANTTTRSVTNAVNSMSDFATESTSTLAAAANSALNSAVSAANTGINSAVNAATTTLNSIPMMNSIVPLGNGARNNSPRNNGGRNNGAHNNNSGANANSYNNSGSNAANANSTSESSWLTSYAGLFILLVLMFYLLFTAFSQQITAAYRYMVLNVRNALGYIDIDTSNSEMIDAVIPAGKPVTQSMETNDDRTAEKNANNRSILQKLLPLSSPEVFNVNKNDYSFYDAEPLCRALGAELATYDQVKEAWTKGADWCNYGWVKGQVAVYPTQPETYDKLQSGPRKNGRHVEQLV